MVPILSLSVREEDVRLLFELKEMSHRQKEEIKTLQRDIEHYACEVENVGDTFMLAFESYESCAYSFSLFSYKTP